MWFEELDQFANAAAVRNIEQSRPARAVWRRGRPGGAPRGATAPKALGAGGGTAGTGHGAGAGEPATPLLQSGAPRPAAEEAPHTRRAGGGCGRGWIFKSFKPAARQKPLGQPVRGGAGGRGAGVPQRLPAAGVPPEWLGGAFLERAAALEQQDPEPCPRIPGPGQPGGRHGVFKNAVPPAVSEEEIAGFDRVYNGVDWGWYPDCWAFVRCACSPGRAAAGVFASAPPAAPPTPKPRRWCGRF